MRLTLPKLKAKKPKPLTAAERHAKRYPAMQLHPAITTRHRAFWETNPVLSRSALRKQRFGKGRVLFTHKEGGTWQQWPWNWVPDLETLKQLVAFSVEWETAIVPFEGEWANKHYKIHAHAMLIDGRRWDCINGFTPTVAEMAGQN